MESAGLWLAVVPVVGTLILFAPHMGNLDIRRRLPWSGVVVLLLAGNTLLAQCSVRAEAASDVARRLFPDPTSVFTVYDEQSRTWLAFTDDADLAKHGAAPDVRGKSVAGSGTVKSSPGSASMSDRIGVQTAGSDEQRLRLDKALELLAGTKAGSAVLHDVLIRDGVVISFTEQVGVDLPTGHVLSTGGTAVTKGQRIELSSEAYGSKSVQVIAAMIGHELVHVAQNLESGSAWWQWPWTTVDRELTAHLLQAIVWAEVRDYQRDWEQDRNLAGAQNPLQLRNWITSNAAYPWWLAPRLGC
ncbi:MAG: hypothetical protein ACYC4L_01920 [Chloroflexota bacterium]